MITETREKNGTRKWLIQFTVVVTFGFLLSGAEAQCKSDDSNHLSLALNYVSYQDTRGNAVIPESAAQAVVQEMNQIWAQCNLSFLIEKYQTLEPQRYGFAFDLAESSELDQIRRVLDEKDRLLVVTTGAWNREGSIGGSAANAWTTLPNFPPYGVILEAPVSKMANLIAHELGHYLNLLHVNDQASLMDPVIYVGSLSLSPSECDTARAAARNFWALALR